MHGGPVRDPPGAVTLVAAGWRGEVLTTALQRRGVDVDQQGGGLRVVTAGATVGDRTPGSDSATHELVEQGAPDLPAGVAEGFRLLPRGCTVDELVRELSRPHRLPRGRGQAPERSPRLTAREAEVLRHVALGHSNTRIAADLGLSPHTVRTHVQNLLRQLGAPNRTVAVTLAHRHGLL